MKKFFTLLALIIISCGLYAQQVTTWAGDGTYGYSGTGSADKLVVKLGYPYGIAFNSSGIMWLSEESDLNTPGVGHTIKMILTDNTARTRLGQAGADCFANNASLQAKFSQPRGMAISSTNWIYVADFGNSVIRKIQPYTSLGNAQWGLVYAGKWDSTQNAAGGCNTPHPGFADGAANVAQFNEPTDIAFGSGDTMYVADMTNHAIRKIVKGVVSTIAGGPTKQGYQNGTLANAKFNTPMGLYVTSKGIIYVADMRNQAIRKIVPWSNSVTTVDSGGLIYAPADLVVADDGTIFIADQNRVLKRSGSQTTILAGSNIQNENGYKDASDTNARFDYLTSIIFHRSSTGVYNQSILYVADQHNNRIRKIVICKGDISNTISITSSNAVWSGDTVVSCPGATVTLQAPAGTGYTYKWSNNSAFQSINITNDISNLSCTITDANGCFATTKKIWVKFKPFQPTVTANGPITFCTGGSVTLVGQGSLNWYKWTKDGVKVDSGGTNKQSLSITTSGTYVLTAGGVCTGSSKSIVVTVSNTEIPLIDTFMGSAKICPNDSVVLKTPNTYTTYQWKKNAVAINGATQQQLVVKDAGSYTLSITKTGGCSGTSDPVVTSLNTTTKPTINVSYDSLLTCSVNATSYKWYCNNVAVTGGTTKSIIAKKNGDYYVEIVDANGCKVRSDATKVVVSIFELNQENRFKVYPNPTSGLVTFRAELNTTQKLHLIITDMLGKVIVNEEETVNGNFEKQFDLSSYHKGMYFVSVTVAGKTGLMKLVVK